ncbi:MAG: signal peptidase I [Candidatus Fimenecus sp.]
MRTFKSNPKKNNIPSSNEIKAELERIENKNLFKKQIFTNLSYIIIAAAIAVLISSYFFSVVQITGISMEPTLTQGNICVLRKCTKFKRGDLCAFHYQNKILIKRVVAIGEDVIDITEDGSLTINGTVLKNSYEKIEKSKLTHLKFPITVPENKYFVLGDNICTSIDSRNSDIGFISKDTIEGKIIYRIFPIKNIKRFYIGE